MSDPAQTPTEPATPATPTPPVTSETPSPTPEAPAAPEPPKSSLDDPLPEPFDAEKLTLPEGFDRKTDAFSEFANVAKEIGLTGPAAQKLVDYHLKYTEAAGKALYESWEAQQQKWIDEVKADREIGGTGDVPISEAVRQTFSQVADNPALTDPGFREALAFTGAGNNPAVIRTLYRWAKALGEGASVAGGPPARQGSGALSNEQPSIANALYGPGGPHSGGPKLS